MSVRAVAYSDALRQILRVTIFSGPCNRYLVLALHFMQVIGACICRSEKPTSEARSKLCGWLVHPKIRLAFL
jgi:hypothetical protein